MKDSTLSQTDSREHGEGGVGDGPFRSACLRCIHRHYDVSGLSHLFCRRLRQRLDRDGTRQLTVEQVRRSVNAYLQYHDLPPAQRDDKFEKELSDQRYYQCRNAQALQSYE